MEEKSVLDEIRDTITNVVAPYFEKLVANQADPDALSEEKQILTALKAFAPPVAATGDPAGTGGATS